MVQPFVFVIGMTVLAFGGLGGTVYFWRLSEQLKKVHLSATAEIREHRENADDARKDLQRYRAEAEVLKKQIRNSEAEKQKPGTAAASDPSQKDWKREAELLARERNNLLGEVQRLNNEMKDDRKRRNSWKAEAEAAEAKAAKAAAEAKAAQEAAAKKANSASVSTDGLETLYAEIDESMKKLKNVPQAERAKEFRNLKRAYHPDAQKLKSAAVQQLFTQLSQYVNGFCEAHLRRDCHSCHSTI